MSSEADASIIFESDDSALSDGLDEVLARFDAISESIQSNFGAANTAIAATNSQIGGLSATTAAVGAQGTAGMTGFARGLFLASQTARLVTVSVATIAGGLAKLAPMVKFIPDAWGGWVAPVKAAVAENQRLLGSIASIVRGADAIRGRLGLLGAAFLGMSLHEAGASRGMAALGATGAYALSRIVAGTRFAINGLGGLTRGIAGATAGFTRSLGGALSIFAPMAGLALTMGPLAGSMIGVASAATVMGKAMNRAAEMQDFTTSMATLLGSTTAAQKRMSELATFAATTPFAIPEVVKASKVLETLTRGALSTGAGLRLVGDAAAVTGEPFDQLSVHVGRLYDGLMNGRPVGEAMMRLQELGLISSQTRARIEALQKEGKKGGEVWGIAARELLRFSGEMERRSGTWTGQLSNFNDAVDELFRQFGAPLITGLTPFLTRFTAWIQTLTPWAQRFGAQVAGWGVILAQAFVDGKISTLLGASLKVAFGVGVNYLLGLLTGVGNAVFRILTVAFRSPLDILAVATTPGFWSGLGNALMAAGKSFLALLLDGIASILDTLGRVPGLGVAGAGAANLRNTSNRLKDSATDSGSAALDLLAGPMAVAGQRLEQIMASIGDSFSAGFRDGRQVVDVSGWQNELRNAFAGVRTSALKTMADVTAASQRTAIPQAKPISADPNAVGKKQPEVSDLRRVGGGGFASGVDPVIDATRRNTSALQTNTLTLGQLGQTMTRGLRVVSVLG